MGDSAGSLKSSEKIAVSVGAVAETELQTKPSGCSSSSKGTVTESEDLHRIACVRFVSKKVLTESGCSTKAVPVRPVSKAVLAETLGHSRSASTRPVSKRKKCESECLYNSAIHRPLSVRISSETVFSGNCEAEKAVKLMAETDSASKSASHRPLSVKIVAEPERLSNSARCKSMSAGIVAETTKSSIGRCDAGSAGVASVSSIGTNKPGDSDSLCTLEKVSMMEDADLVETDSDNEDDPPFLEQYSDQDYDDSEFEAGLSDTGAANGDSFNDGEEAADDVANWNSNLDYLFCCLGFVCGLSNILQFPCLAAKYGGATFCLAYSMVVFLCGVPMVYLETVIGQFSGHGPIKSWTIVPLFSGLGFAMVLISILISIYHSIYVTWIVYYLGLMFSPDLTGINSSAINPVNYSQSSSVLDEGPVIKRPFEANSPNRYTLHSSHSGILFHDQVLSLSEGADRLGDVQPLLLACLLLTWLTVCLLLTQGTRIMPKVLYILIPLPVILIISLLIRSCFVEGAVEGIRFYLTPNWYNLICPEMWWDVSRQVFFSLGLGTGALISLSSRSDFHSNCHRNALVITVGNVFSSVFTGFLVFSLLGAISHKHNTSPEELISYDTDVSFLLVLEVLGGGPGGTVWAGLFFLLLCIVGLSRQCFLVHNIITSAKELIAGQEGCSRQGHITLTGLTCILLCLPAMALTTQAGMYVARLLNEFVCKWGLFFLCLCECVTVMWVYGGPRFLSCVTQMCRRQDNLWWRVMWSGVTPAACLVILFLTWWGHDPLSYGDYSYPPSLEAVGWFISCLPITAISLGVLIKFGLSPGSFRRRLDLLTKTPADWGRGHSGEIIIPEYIACSPEDPLKEPVIPPDVTSGLLWNMFALASVAEVRVPQIYNQTQDMSPGGGYLTDMVDIDGYSADTNSSDDENKVRGNWAGKLEFIMSGLGYVVGLGNVWRFPYLVYRNGGGAFFIPYLTMLIFCGIPLVFMELSFGQYASLGPISMWKSVPLLKGVGVSMVIISALVSLYSNMVVAWSFLYLFTSMTSKLPWISCKNTWNTVWCNANILLPGNCSADSTSLTNSSQQPSYNMSEQYSGDITPNGFDPFCTQWSVNTTNNTLSVLHKDGFRYNTPSEEFFYLYILNISGTIGELGHIQWKLALTLLLAWTLIFIFLVRGIKSSGKVMYLIVIVPYLTILTLLIQSTTMDGYLDGIKYYVTPNWSLLGEARVWSDAAAQIFFSLSVCWGGLSTLASYNKFQNNIYRDALIICLGDTLMSVLAGFSVFSMIGVLGKQLNTTVENVIQSDVGLTFIAYPEAISRFPISPLWSVLFFLMLCMIGLSTQITTVETIVTAIVDENMPLLKRRRVWMLLFLCCLLYLLGLPLTTQGGIYWLQLMDEYLAGWSVMVLGIIMCLGLCYLYGVNKFRLNIMQMVGEMPSLWWKIMWCLISPLVIVFILIFAMVDYAPAKFGLRIFPPWAQAVGFCLTIVPLLPIPFYMVYRIVSQEGTFLQKIKSSYQADTDWGPALGKYWDIQYMPTVTALINQPIHDLGVSSIETVTERVEFTTTGVRTGCLSESSLLTGSTNLNSPISRKHYDNIRQRAILQHAYSNPQCNASLYNSSSEKLQVSRQNSSNSDYIIMPRKKRAVEMCDKSTQTGRGYISSLSLKNVSGEIIAGNGESTNCPVAVEMDNMEPPSYPEEAEVDNEESTGYPIEVEIEMTKL
ncbi:uncharacterized protein LOC135472612 [Liolophura sinensis]|uniref:uncharacterized protein LOC135472612 n=1 Tax=Liolophura sinensis TaxID=3198878 RepID=UPI0031585328